MKPLHYALFVILFVQIGFSQNTKLIDSLKTELKKKKENDTTKIKILTRLHEKLMFSEPEEALKYAKEELKIAEQLNYKKGVALGNMHIADYLANKNENDSALYHYNIAKKTFSELNHTRGVIFVNHSLASIESTIGNLDQAINITKENIKLIEKYEKSGPSKTKFIGAQYNSLANNYIEKANFKTALIYALQALNCFEEINHESRKADVLKQIGDIESGLGNHESSIKYFNEALEIYERFNEIFYMAYTQNSIGISYQNLNNLEQAEHFYKLAVENARKVEDNMGLTNALHNLGELKRIEKNYTDAIKIVNEAKLIAEKEGIKIGIINAAYSLAKIEFHLKKYNAALKQNKNAILISKSIGALSHLADLYKQRSIILESQNKNNDALEFLKLYQTLNDSLFNSKKFQQIQELKTIYETEKKEAQIALQNEEINTLNVQAENDKLIKTLYAIGMFSFLAIAGLLYFGFKQRIKKNKLAREKQEEIYKQEIEFKQKELASQTLHLVQKNTFIQELKENLEKIKQSPELFKVEFRRLVMLLKKESAEDKDWEVFKSYFSEVHNNFDNKLKAIYADISEKEIRLASFLRMNLSTKEIASMLNVLPESVLKSKYRLKKKLKLEKETDLGSFLNSL
ncbi:tetratricopeptide repeat protein [Tamlana sp. 62-3]|uniref:Tetratricopeptide repeat protein n=1 Tax=Neotamlana sargassicola TaxID=2883125 RepID=A0A9X1I5Q6_9FLAO|nr:tetratricopeptide repeat protein [Tamlana sargassicola]MCB4808350.1 tetratricopeptide repeat protein [Tamlana sargassicola]